MATDLADVSFLNVGQGDCSVIHDESTGSAMVVDCPMGGGSALRAHLDGRHIQVIAVAMFSHPHLDHYGDLYSALEGLAVEEVRFNTTLLQDAEGATLKKLRATLRAWYLRADSNYSEIGPTDDGEFGHVKWEAYSPTDKEKLASVGEDDPNHSSVVLRVCAGESAVLIGADATGLILDRLLQEDRDISSDVARLPHHGADQLADSPATYGDLHGRVGATVYVISVGTNNRNKHPNAKVMRELRDAGAGYVLCTELTRICCMGPTVAARVPCAGDIRVSITDQGWSMDPDPAEHRKRVLATLTNPLCACA